MILAIFSLFQLIFSIFHTALHSFCTIFRSAGFKRHCTGKFKIVLYRKSAELWNPLLRCCLLCALRRWSVASCSVRALSLREQSLSCCSFGTVVIFSVGIVKFGAIIAVSVLFASTYYCVKVFSNCLQWSASLKIAKINTEGTIKKTIRYFSIFQEMWKYVWTYRRHCVRLGVYAKNILPKKTLLAKCNVIWVRRVH